MTEDETVGWHHRFDGHESEQALGIGGWKITKRVQQMQRTDSLEKTLMLGKTEGRRRG